ncbi:MAG: STAS domain-containing protein [Caldimonas sp.]
MSAQPRMPDLPADLSIYSATETRAGWLAWLAAESSGFPADVSCVDLDGNRVDVVDGSGVQLLLALSRTLRERGLALRLTAPSGALRTACAALGSGSLVAPEASA